MFGRSARRVVLIAAIVLTLVGCASFTRDVSNDDALWGGYDRHKEYKLLREVFIIRVNASEGSKGKLVLVPERSLRRSYGRHYTAPYSIREYREDPKKATTYTIKTTEFTIDVVGILPAGTRLKCAELYYRSGWNFMVGSFQDLTPWAKVMDGTFAGTLLEITDVSIFYRENADGVFKYRPEAGVIALVAD